MQHELEWCWIPWLILKNDDEFDFPLLKTITKFIMIKEIK